VRRDWRHRAREAAVQILYQWDVGGVDLDAAIETVFVHQWSGVPAPELQELAARLARGTVARLDAVDRLIADTTERWRPERMAVVDRLILRMAVSELMDAPASPKAVVINEALELARTFSTEEAVRFINGILDAIGRKLDQRPSPA
jgi:N utilization substance protein B